jgi:DNA-binding transcriptional ArsR family regulator
MRTLNPTLWRTCRMLTGATRVKLLRQLHDQPGRSISALAQAVQIGISDASQELRRIQSRGLLQVERRGSYVYYRLGADPQVPSAGPLLQALKATLANTAKEKDSEIIQIANGLAHARRIAIAKELIRAPRTLAELQSLARMPRSAVSLHGGVLVRSGLVCRTGRGLAFAQVAHPLARALVRLVKE